MGPHGLHDTRLARGLIRGFLQGILVQVMPADPHHRAGPWIGARWR